MLSSFWVGDDIMEVVSTTLDSKVKTPPFCHPGLPDSACFIVFFRAKGRMTEIAGKKKQATIECALDIGRCTLVAAKKAIAVAKVHHEALRFLLRRAWEWRERIACLAVAKGP